MILDHFNKNKDFYNSSVDTPELTTKKLRTWMRSNGWKKSHFKEGEVRTSPRKRAKKDALASCLPLGDDDDDDDDGDDEGSDDDDDDDETAELLELLGGTAASRSRAPRRPAHDDRCAGVAGARAPSPHLTPRPSAFPHAPSLGIITHTRAPPHTNPVPPPTLPPPVHPRQAPGGPPWATARMGS